MNPDLNEYGQEFPDFIGQLTPLISLPYLSDVARLEWAWQKITNRGKYENGNIEQLKFINKKETNNIIFHLNSDSSLLQSDFLIHNIWNINQTNNDSKKNIDINHKVNLLIWKNNSNMYITEVTAQHFLFLKLILEGRVYSDICNIYIENYPNNNISERLLLCLQNNWIHSFNINSLN